jgi:hypothetical protein
MLGVYYPAITRFNLQPMRLSRKPLIKHLGLASGIALILSFQGCSLLNHRGVDNPEKVVEQYLLALERKDEKSILQLVPQSYSADKAIKDKITRFGGRKIQERKIEYIRPKPIFIRANIKGSYIGSNGIRKNFEDILTIAYEKRSFWEFNRGRWYLLIGKGKVSTPKIQSAEPQIYPSKKSP